MPQFHTVIPIHNVDLDPAASFEFSGGLILVPLPTWVHGQKMLNDLSATDREAVKAATHGFLLSYEADALGSPDPDWEEGGPLESQDVVEIR